MSINKLVKIEDHPELKKDTETQAVLNVDIDNLSAYKIQRNIRKKQKYQITKYESDINTLKSEVNELKEMINSFLKNTSKG